MAAWQADFELRPDEAPLPPDYRTRLDALLPPARSWAPGLEMWGEEDGNRIDVWPAAGANGGEAMLRIDLRAYDPDWGARALDTIRALGRDLWPVWRDEAPISDPAELALVLSGSPAFRFVENPDAFLRRVRIGGHEDAWPGLMRLQPNER
jgi:hypothetical protein